MSRVPACGLLLASLAVVGTGRAADQPGIDAAPGDPPPAIRDRLAGFRNLELYAIETRWVPGLNPTESQAEQHLAWQVELERKGILFAAGPLFAEGAPRFPPAGGLVVVRAASFEAARAIADGDPMHRAGLRTYSVRRWIVNEGSFEVTIRLSDRHGDIK